MIRKIYKKADALLSNRLLVLALLFLALFAVLTYRIFFIQIVRGDTYKNQFVYKVRKTVRTSGTRGNIYDSKGRLLAYNKLVYTVNFQNDSQFKTIALEKGISESQEKNAVIYQVIKVLDKNHDSFINEIPIEITGSGKFRFTESGTRLEKFKRDAFGIGTDTAGLSSKERELRSRQLNASAKQVFEYFKNGTLGSAGAGKMFEINDTYSDKAALKIMSVRYSAYQSRYSQYMKVTFAKEVSSKSIAELEERKSELPGIEVDTSSIRVYNCSEAMSHIIGYTGTVSTDELDTYNKGKNESDSNYYASDDIVGKSGIEKEMESYLHGNAGSNTMVVNNIGKIISTVKVAKSGTGNNIKLSIDSRLQEYVYNQLEKRIAGIVLSKLTTSDSKGDRDNLKIPIKDVYNSFIANGVIDISALGSSDASKYEKKAFKQIRSLKKDAIKGMQKKLKSSSKPLKDENDEYREYAAYVYKMLVNKNVLQVSSIDSSNKEYKKWKDEKISLGSFLKYAINNEWIDITNLSENSSYSDTEELFDSLVLWIGNQLDDDDDFLISVCEQKIKSGKLSGKTVCLLLYEQGVLTKKKDKDYKSLQSGSLDSFSFIKRKLKALKITPAQLGMDPCSGSVVITDSKTGKVKAMVSYPGYDSNRMSGGIDNSYYRQLSMSSSTPLYNQVLFHRTAPGSTFKPLSAITALNEGVITPHTSITDEGIFDKISPPAKCWIYPSNHGTLNVSGALEVSCNYFFYEVGYQLGRQKGSYNSQEGLDYLSKYAKKIGLNKKSGVELDEISPHVSDETSVRSAIGQGTNSFAPIQISNYVTTLSSRGTVYDLSILDSVTSSSGKVIKKYGVKKEAKLKLKDEKFWDAVQSGMRRVVAGKNGSVNAIFQKMKVAIAGKTGTAQENKKRANHALFISFGPYKKPEISVTTVIPFGYTSSNAATVSKDVYNYYFADEKEKIKLETKKVETSSATGAAGD